MTKRDDLVCLPWHKSKDTTLRPIIYAPQQENMANIFCQPGTEGDEQDVWHVVQARFREHGYELYTPENYDGALKDAAWVIFQNMPRDFKPMSLIKRIKQVVQQALGKGTFYQRCVKAGMADRIAVALYEPPIVEEFAYDKKKS